jgi:negative regulator of sigma E activity
MDPSASQEGTAHRPLPQQSHGKRHAPRRTGRTWLAIAALVAVAAAITLAIAVVGT